MKLAKLILLSSTFSAYTYATEIDLASIDPEKARAYQAYLLTFEWPKGTSSEEVTYEDIKNSTNIVSYDPPELNIEESTTRPATIEPLFNAFDGFNKKVGRHAKVLSNEKWTFIFPEAGFTHHETFHSTIDANGYVDLNGDISVKLGRYLETELNYQHYLFSTLENSEASEEDKSASEENKSAPLDSAQNEQTTLVGLPSAQSIIPLRPIQVLNLTLNNKTASKKINYLDHPIIGTLLYFVPMDLEEAIEQKALESFTPDLGENKTQEDLTSSELE
ncbi:CsiV family protein [Marinomonas balearica]|uniref:Peptidoglycan-binding protein CsiV n=1 Tax=Marinomonas balearica TaxID=491947 RepID=A0A4R6MDH5_9GAMM|nr:CsiV family protein [Marinomonas balearica]TDO99613.1 peptidoglycan-binding protein CsiV [Marinomonas balearica]